MAYQQAVSRRCGPRGVAMSVKTEGAAVRRSGARASGQGPAGAAAMEHLSHADPGARGKDARAVAPLESHGEFRPGGSRDPVGFLLGQAKSRVPEPVPVRHGRMLVSPFTFYRGLRCRWRRIWRARPLRGCGCRCAGTRNCPISARSPRRSGGWSFPSTISTRRCLVRPSGMSSGWPRALPWPDRRRALRDIARDLADSDPRLDELFFSFTQLASDVCPTSPAESKSTAPNTCEVPKGKAIGPNPSLARCPFRAHLVCSP